MKVVWLCHFVNQEMKTFFHTPNVKEYCPWINNLIELFKGRDDIELHIVSPNSYTNKQKDLLLKNVSYHFYQQRPYFITKKLYTFLRVESWTNFYFVKKRIVKTINSINPDIIHLHGAELPIYSSGILPLINKFNTLVTIQGFVRNTKRSNWAIKKRIQIEETILKKAPHIGVRTKEMSETALELNPNAQLHFHNYPITIPNYIKDSKIPSAFDIIYFARLTKDKGIEDLFQALAIIKKTKPDVSLHIIGGANKSYMDRLRVIIKRFNIEENIKFLGFMETQQEIFKYAISAKICVLPTYHDIIPGTIIESMFVKLPVVAYAVGGIPELNEKGEALLLVEKNNIEQLSQKILDLLNDKDRRTALAEYAYILVTERFKNQNVVKDIVKAYNEILSQELIGDK